jgi:hypothetical protein
MARKKPPPPRLSVSDPMTEVDEDDDTESPGISDDVVWLQGESDERDDTSQKGKKRRRESD